MKFEQQGGAEDREPTREEKQALLEGLRKRKEDLEVWRNNWIRDDVELHERLTSQIEALEKDLKQAA